MEPYFIWKGQDSRDWGIWVTELPAPTRAKERTEEITIPGRAGALLYKEGDNVHDAYIKECVVTIRSEAAFDGLLEWLSGAGDLILSNEPDRAYTASVAAEVKFTKISNSLKKATIPFYVHPHKAQFPPESTITLTADGAVYNPGTVASRPLVAVTFTQTATVVIGTTPMVFTAHPVAEGESYTEETIYVDCDAEIITDSGGIWQGTSSGDFWQIQPGSQSVTLVGATVVITPRWRWY